MGDWEGTKEKNSFFQWTRMNNCRHDHQTDMHFDKTDYSMNLFPFSFFLFFRLVSAFIVAGICLCGC